MDWVFIKQAKAVNVTKELDDLYGDWYKAQRDFEKKSHKSIVQARLKALSPSVSRMLKGNPDFEFVSLDTDPHLSNGDFIEVEVEVVLKNKIPEEDAADRYHKVMALAKAMGFNASAGQIKVSTRGDTSVILGEWSKTY